MNRLIYQLNKPFIALLSGIMLFTGLANGEYVGTLDGTSYDSTFENVPSEGGSIALPDSYNWSEIAEQARAFRDSAVNTNAALISDTSATANYTVQLDTGVAIETSHFYTLTAEMGFMTTPYTEDRIADFNIALGTIETGGDFTQLAGSVGSIIYTQHFGQGASGSSTVNYYSGDTVSGDNLAVRLSRTGGNGFGRWFGFDNVILTTVSGYPLASVDSPLNEHIMIPIDSSLRWFGPTAYDASGYDVYVHTNKTLVDEGDPSALVSTNQINTFYTPPDKLDSGTTYYWRIDSYEPQQEEYIIHEGITWSFTIRPDTMLAGDFDKDSKVDLKDIAEIGLKWVLTYDVNNLEEITNNWLEGTSPLTIQVMSYNIHHGEGTDGVLDLERIAQVILQSGAQIIGLNEVDKNWGERSDYVDQAYWLAQRLDMYYCFGPAIDNDPHFFGNAVLSEYPIVYSENHQLPQYNGNEPRACIVTIVNINGRLLPYLVTHLDHLEESARIMQAEELLNISGKIDSHKILAGDMNCHPDSVPIVVLEQAFTDTFDIVGNTSDHVDYIFVSNNFNGGVNYSAFIINPLTQVASDHKPVIAEIVLQP